MVQRFVLGRPGIAGWLIHVTATLILWPWCFAFSSSAFAQTFIEQGPGPRFGPAYAAQSADQSPNGTEGGAIQAILPDPALGSNTMFVGSPNGGIWVTTNNGASWTPLTDKQASLSIASLALDPNDKTGKTIIAGVGITDNGEYSQFNQPAPQGRGGARTGVLYSNDGGATWSALGGATLAGKSVIGAEVRGQTILAATYEVQAPLMNTAGYGLYRSVTGGSAFSLVSGAAGSGLPAGAVTSLAADPNNPANFYAAVRTTGNRSGTSVYFSDNSGATWRPVFQAVNSNGIINANADTAITLAAGPKGSVALAITALNPQQNNGQLAGVFLSTNGGSAWTQLNAPQVNPGNQAPVNLHVAIDPSNANIVYLSGDAYQNCGINPGSFCSIQAFRLATNASPGQPYL